MRKNNLDQLNEEKPENLSPKSKSKIVLTYNVAEDLEKLLQFDRSKYRDYKSKIKDIQANPGSKFLTMVPPPTSDISVTIVTIY